MPVFYPLSKNIIINNMKVNNITMKVNGVTALNYDESIVIVNCFENSIALVSFT